MPLYQTNNFYLPILSVTSFISPKQIQWPQQIPGTPYQSGLLQIRYYAAGRQVRKRTTTRDVRSKIRMTIAPGKTPARPATP